MCDEHHGSCRSKATVACSGNYALFLSEVKQDYDAAVQHYKQSLNIGNLPTSEVCGAFRVAA